MERAKIERESGGGWRVIFEGEVVLTGESYSVAAGVEHALNTRSYSGSEVAEIASEIYTLSCHTRMLRELAAKRGK